MSSKHDPNQNPNQNHLLAALPGDEFGRISPFLELVPMLLGDVIYESGGKLQHVYFPTTSIISLSHQLENGGSSESAGVGNEGGVGMRLLLRYTQALITQMSQTSVCNRHHSVEQQLCRWLLLTLDRVPSNELTMTQELIANMLGVRREGVTEAAGRLQGYGFISYRRGHITVVDRVGLERDVCECYGVVKKEFARLLSDVRQR